MEKEKILHTATDSFLTLGFKSVTMDDLANEMGISKKTIYNHFNNKTDLVKECTMRLFDQISLGINHICDQKKNPIEELYDIKKFVMLHLKNEASSPEYQLQKYYPAIHANLKHKQFELIESCVSQNVDRGIKMNIYRENLDIPFVVRIYYIGVTGIKDASLFPQEQFAILTLMDTYLEYHLRGIVTLKGRETLNKIINSNKN